MPNKDGGRGKSKTCRILLKFAQITQISQEHNWFKEELDRRNFWKNESPYYTCIYTDYKDITFEEKKRMVQMVTIIMDVMIMTMSKNGFFGQTISSNEAISMFT